MTAILAICPLLVIYSNYRFLKKMPTEKAIFKIKWVVTVLSCFRATTVSHFEMTQIFSWKYTSILFIFSHPHIVAESSLTFCSVTVPILNKMESWSPEKSYSFSVSSPNREKEMLGIIYNYSSFIAQDTHSFIQHTYWESTMYQALF